MHRILLGVALATAMLATAADAAPRHKHHHVAHAPQVAAQTYAPAVRAPQIGPAWSGPNQCWTDEGYGRYAPCDSGRGGGM